VPYVSRQWASTVDRDRLGEEDADTVPAVSLNTLLDDPVDYLKVDIEGAEREVLRQNTGWAERVRCIKVEVHAPYTAEECAHDLTQLGFLATIDRRPPGSVLGRR
jgi:hypothetical protein